MIKLRQCEFSQYLFSKKFSKFKIIINVRTFMKNFLKLIGSIFVCFLPGIVGGFFTANNLYPWYDTLVKPSFNPPSWVFSPVWTMLYTLMGISLFLLLKAENSENRTQGLVFFVMQLILNSLWSIIFFELHQILWAFVVIIFLLLFIILSIWKFYQVSKTTAYILVPYLLWVSFATVLNFSIYRLNG